jgi:putative transposase
MMAWTAEDRCKYAPMVQEIVRQGMIVRLAAMIDAIDPVSRVGRPRVWSTLIMLRALWHLARDGCAWRRLPPGCPPHQSVWSRLTRWGRRAVLDRALAVVIACRRLAAGRKRRPTAAIIDTQSVKTGPQRGPRGFDANKKIKGRKRVLMIDVEGDPLGVRVVAADAQDRDALQLLAPDLAAHASSWLGSTAVSPATTRRLSSKPTASPPNSSAPSAARGSGSNPGAGRSSKPSAVCNATVACASTTR